MEERNVKLIAVAGMHRSGTSVIARGLQVLGVELGSRLMPPSEGNNSKGFWEDVDINDLNIEILHFLKNEWHSLTPVQPSDVDTLCKNGYLQRAVKLLNKKTAGVPVFGFKDPRVAKLLPFWKEVFAYGGWKTHYIIVIRHPLSVSESLAKRDHFDFEKSYLLWLEHVIGSLAGTQGETRVLVDYDDFMQSPQAGLERIANRFQLVIDSVELQRFQGEFLDHNLRHTVHPLDALTRDPASHPLVREVYSSLLESIAGSAQLEDAGFETKIAHWDRELSRLRSTLVFIDRLGLRIASVASVRDSLNAQQNTWLQERTQMAQRLQGKEQELQNVKAELQAIYQSRWWRWTESLRQLLSRRQRPK